MLAIEMLPAREGDALWIEYGDPAAPRRLLVDCGSKGAYRELMRRLDADPALRFELFVLTHIDGDHVAGAVPLFRDPRWTPAHVAEVWFNDRERRDDTLGVRHGEHFAHTLAERGFRWNEVTRGNALVMPDGGPGPPVELAGGLRLTLLSPGRSQLDALLSHWNDGLDDLLRGRPLDELLAAPPAAYEPDVLGEPSVAALARRPFEPDDSVPNGSSIALLAEYRDRHDGDREKRVLLAGDAHSPVLEGAVGRLLAARGADRLALDAYKVSHHGSRANNGPRLFELLDCSRFLFSTDGSRHRHPDAETIARILVSREETVELHFNYHSENNRRWRSPSLARLHRYRPCFPAAGAEGLRVEL